MDLVGDCVVLRWKLRLCVRTLNSVVQFEVVMPPSAVYM
jgi:hypothetical protein